MYTKIFIDKLWFISLGDVFFFEWFNEKRYWRVDKIQDKVKNKTIQPKTVFFIYYRDIYIWPKTVLIAN